MNAHLKYLWYVCRHKWFVLLASWHYGCLWRGLVHDLSKFWPSEWFPYSNFFYGNWKKHHEEGKPPPPEVKDDFDRAWLLHQNRNPHHWNYWLLRKDGGAVVAMEMPDIYVREMVADWTGAGRAITGKVEVVDWYQKNREKMTLHPRTQALVEHLLKINSLVRK